MRDAAPRTALRSHCSRPPASGAILIGQLLICACASPMPVMPEPTPSEIAGLEARVASDSSDIDASVRLGAAYRRVDRPEEARPLLERALMQRPDDATATLHLGLTYEDLEHFGQARATYERYLEEHSSSRAADLIRARLPLLQRRELEVAVRQAVRNEARLDAAATDPRAIGVFPFLYDGRDPALQPLSRALAELLTTDLSQTDRLTVLERSRVQLLLDELELARTDLVDSTTAARGGRLLGAGRIVQGRIDGDESEIRLQAAVVDAAQRRTLRTTEQQDALARLFDLEKQLALDLFASLGIDLTVAERERVIQRPTENLQAVLAFGRGLIASDAGDHATAAREFEEAARLDRGFTAARQHAARAGLSAVALNQSTDDIASQATFDTEDLDVLLAAVESIVPTAAARDPAAEALGTEGIGRSTILEIIIRRD